MIQYTGQTLLGRCGRFAIGVVGGRFGGRVGAPAAISLSKELSASCDHLLRGQSANALVLYLAGLHHQRLVLWRSQ